MSLPEFTEAELVAESWRDIPGLPGYQVSDLGRVRSFWRKGCRTGFPDGPAKLMSRGFGPFGYRRVKMARQVFLVHALVLAAFVGPRPGEDFDCRHLDGDPSNNRLGNLRWGTRKENMADMISHERDGRGEKGSAAKLTDADALEIRRRCAAGELQRVVAADFGITRTNVSLIVHRHTFRHI